MDTLASGATDFGLARAAVERFGLPVLHPIVEERSRRRLSLVGSVREQIARELVTPNLGYTSAGLEREDIIRVNFHCNQTCRFCFVSTHLPAAEHEAIAGAIERAAAAGVVLVASAGNNPTDVFYPARHPLVVAVGAITRSGAVASYSARGTGLDLVAPGGDGSPGGLVYQDTAQGIVGIAGTFVGYHLAVLIGIFELGALIVAIIGAVAALWGWRMVR